jgi:hypothetical protein
MRFEDYFSFEAIVRDLVKWRVAGKDVGGTLPPRKMWSRAGEKERKRVDPAVVRKQAIFRTVRRACGGALGFAAETAALHTGGPQFIAADGARDAGGERAVATSCDPPGGLGNFEWGRKLVELVEGVREAVFSGKVAFEPPKMFKIAKGRENGQMAYREVASFERLADRVILSRMTAYVRDRLEGILSDRCYSFRRDWEVNHQLAVKHLKEYRARFAAGSLFVAECDIRKFFDSISHEVVRRRWEAVGFDKMAGKVLEAYLAVYAVGAEGNGRDARCPSGEECNGRDARCPSRRGLPQGGSFSTVLANLVLAAADDAVAKGDDGQLFYARYCDDVVFVHPDEAACSRAMDAYAAALDRLDLPMHPVESFVYRREDDETTRYYSLKSKGPFRWREAARGEMNCAPWVSFLGSQVRCDGATRIRKESIEKHIRSLGRETAAAVRELESGMLLRGRSRGTRDPTMRRSRGDRPTGAMAWFARFRNRLITKGVGYVTAKVKDCHMCWAGAFPSVTPCVETKMQMRRLDRVREGMLCKVWNMLMSSGGRGATAIPKRRYKGRPFSYFGFLKEAARPTNLRAVRYGGQANMAPRDGAHSARRGISWRAMMLPYSEL